MIAGAKYGLLLGIVLSVLSGLKSPLAWASYWVVQTFLLTIYARLTWRRTGLLLFTLCGAHAAIVSAAMVPASLLGLTLGNLPSPWDIVVWANLLAMPIWVLTERLVYPAQWRLWKQHMESISLREMLMFRHIPYLR